MKNKIINLGISVLTGSICLLIIDKFYTALREEVVVTSIIVITLTTLSVKYSIAGKSLLANIISSCIIAILIPVIFKLIAT